MPNWTLWDTFLDMSNFDYGHGHPLIGGCPVQSIQSIVQQAQKGDQFWAGNWTGILEYRNDPKNAKNVRNHTEISQKIAGFKSFGRVPKQFLCEKLGF